jgi:hypothetical protein
MAMNLRTRLGVTIATATLGAFGLLGMAACSSPSANSDQSQSMSPEATALTALGFSDSDVTGDSTTGVSATTAPSTGPGAHGNHPRWRSAATSSMARSPWRRRTGTRPSSSSVA